MIVEAKPITELPSEIAECIRSRIEDGLHDGSTVAELAGGANNRLFLLQTASRSYAVKWYYSSPTDLRSRLSSEWSFARFAWQHGIRSLPEPIASCADQNVAIYEFVPGRSLSSNELSDDFVYQAMTFLLELNSHRESAGARELPAASEACFSIQQHLETVQARVTRVNALAQQTSSSSVRSLILDELNPIWESVQRNALTQAAKEQLAAADELPMAARIISPSDFGFHNAIVEVTGRIRFIDFEYAGWDDPAKTICDFFCQPAVPIPRNYLPHFVERLSSIVEPLFAVRAEILLPIYQLKWACIVLNPLTAAGRSRRRFSQSAPLDNPDFETRLIDRARRFLSDAS